MPNARRQAGVFVSALNAAMVHRQIDTPKRQAAFLAQVGHESGQLQYVRELGGDQYLSKYDTGSLASKLGNTPEPDGDGQREVRRDESRGLRSEDDGRGRQRERNRPPLPACRAGHQRAHVQTAGSAGTDLQRRDLRHQFLHQLVGHLVADSDDLAW